MDRGRIFAGLNILLSSGKEYHPQAKNHKYDSGAEVHVFGGDDLAYR